VFLIATNSIPSYTPRPDVAVRNLFDEAATLASPGRTAAIIEQSRRSLQDKYDIPNQMVTLMRNHTVDISPWEQTVAWAYPRIRFDPLPVIQDYSAYTPSLDQLDVNYLASSDAPRFILRQPGQAIDGRDPAFEPPATQLAIECRYHQVSGNGSWQLLERGATAADRCGRSVRSQPASAVGSRYPLRPLAMPSWLVSTVIGVVVQAGGSSLQARECKCSIQRQPAKLVALRYRYRSRSPLLQAPSTSGYYSAFSPVRLTSLRFTIERGYPRQRG